MKSKSIMLSLVILILTIAIAAPVAANDGGEVERWHKLVDKAAARITEQQIQIDLLEYDVACMERELAQTKVNKWESLDELKAFLAQDNTDQVLIIVCNNDGVAKLTGACEDYAYNLQDNAAKIGKEMETEIMTRAEYLMHFGNDGGLKANGGHYINKAVIGNEVYFIEPQTDKV